jgi:hypothetical protein
MDENEKSFLIEGNKRMEKKVEREVNCDDVVFFHWNNQRMSYLFMRSFFN